MKFIKALVCAVLAFASLSDVASAQMTEVPSIAALVSTPPLGNAAYVASYYCTGTPCIPDGKGGEGLFIKNIAATCTTDSGSVFLDSASHCWYRQNLNGDLRQWGVTTGSDYDAAKAVNSALLPLGATSLIQAAYSALLSTGISNYGITSINTNQVSIYLDATLDIPVTSSLNCGATGGSQISGGNYLGRPGSIFLAHKAVVQLQGPVATPTQSYPTDSSYIANCLVLPFWLLPNSTTPPTNTRANAPTSTGCQYAHTSQFGLSFNYPATQYSDLEAIRGNMIICGDDAIVWDTSSGGTSHDLWAFGFDNPFYLKAADHSNLANTSADGDVCYYTEQGGGLTTISTSHCDVTLTRNVLINDHNPLPTNTDCAQIGSGGNSVCDYEYFQIGDIVPSTSLNSFMRPNCQVKLIQGIESGRWTTPPDPASIMSSSIRMPSPAGNPGAVGDPITYPMWIANLNTTTNASSCIGHGPYSITVLPSCSITTSGNPYVGTACTALDLLESDLGMYYAGIDYRVTAEATWDVCSTPPCAVRIVSGNVNAMEPGEIVTGSSPFPAPSNIVSVVRDAKGIDPNDGYLAEVFIDQPLNTAALTDTALQFSSNTSMGPNVFMPSSSLHKCQDSNIGECAFFSTGARPFAGQSIAAKTSAQLPESNTHYYGAGFIDNGTAGLDLLTTFSFGHHYGYVLQDAHETVMTDREGDENGDIADRSTTFYVVNGDSVHTAVQGGKGSKSGTGIVNNFYALTDTSAATVTDPTGVGMGINLTVGVSGVSSLQTDLGLGATGGKGTAGICNHTTSGGCNASHPEEYLTFEIVDSTHILITSRGNYFTVPGTYSFNAMIFSTAISAPKYCDSLSNTSAPVEYTGAVSIENIRGCLQLANFDSEENADRYDFISNNSTGVNISNSNLTGIGFLYENATAYSAMSGCGNILTPPQAWNCSHPFGPISTITASKTVDATATQWSCDATAGAVALQIPLGSTLPNQVFEIKKVDATGNACTITMSVDPNAMTTDSLDGQSSYVLNATNQSVTFKNAGGTASWFTLSTGAPLSPLVNGQVYLSYRGSNTSLQLCPSDGSGLIVNYQLVTIPAACLYLKNTSLSSAGDDDLIYASRSKVTVSNVTVGTGGDIQVMAVNPYKASDQVWASCSGIKGATETNISGLANIITPLSFEFIGTAFTSSYLPSNGSCVLIGLQAFEKSTMVHTTAPNGVETNSDYTKTLVGMVHVGSGQTILDTPQHRDVASWFNRRTKTCIQTPIALNVPVSTTYAELDSTHRCEFVKLGGGNNQWSVAGSGFDSNATAVVSISADFDSPITPEPEFTEGSGTVRFPVNVSGSKVGLTPEGTHWITMLGKATMNAGTLTSGTLIELRILQ